MDVDEPKSLSQIVQEENFLPLAQEACESFFHTFNHFLRRLDKKKPITRKYYSSLVQNAHDFESFLDEHGARENKTWYAFTEFIASIRNLSLSAFYLKHLLDRYPFYNLGETADFEKEFFSDSRDALDFLNKSIINLFEEAARVGIEKGLAVLSDKYSSDVFPEMETHQRLPKNIEEDQVKDESERVVDICQKYRKLSAMMSQNKIERSQDWEALRNLVPAKVDEKRARLYQNMVHSVQSDYDTYVKNTGLEQKYPCLHNLRGYISVPLHLLELVLWLTHFYERHEDEIRTGECKRKIARLVDKKEILNMIINFGFHYALQFIHCGEKISEECLKSLVKTVRYELAVPDPLGFHARPSTYISLIVRQHDGEASMLVDGERFNAKSVMSLLQAGGAVADKGYQTVAFEGDKIVLDDLKILAKHNYCEDKNIPRELSYLRNPDNSSG